MNLDQGLGRFLTSGFFLYRNLKSYLLLASSLSHIITKGEYQLKIIVAAVNAKPREEIIKISLSGEWFDDDKEMLKKGVVLELI